MIFQRNPRPGVTASGAGAVGVGGDVRAPITTITNVLPPRQVDWPACVGAVPELASAFQPRRGVRERIRHGATRVLAGGGGVGKTQLAAWFAREALGDPAVDLVVWVPADSPEQIIATYARAALRVAAPGAGGEDTVADAGAFLEWLRTTDRAWLIVLDDVTDPAHLADWCPPAGRSGWTLATTRLQDAALTGSGRQKIDIEAYAPGESAAYLTERLTGAGLPHLIDARLTELTTALGHLPLALSHAAAYLINQEETCGEYLDRYAGGRERLTDLMPAGSDPDAYGRPVAVTLLLALDAAARSEPVGLARPALELASLLPPATRSRCGPPSRSPTSSPPAAVHRSPPARPAELCDCCTATA